MTQPLPRFLSALLIGIMAGCIAIPITDVVRFIVPTWNTTAIFVLCVISALEALYARYLIRERDLSGLAYLRFRAVEIAALFVVIKFISLLFTPQVNIVALMRQWAESPFSILEAPTLLSFSLALMAWYAATETDGDIENLGRFIFPNEFDAADAPLARLNDRFFLGGTVLMLATGLSRVGLNDLFDFNRTPLAGLLFNALIYFILGLVVLGQARFAALSQDWEMRSLKVSSDVGQRWLQYIVIFVVFAGVAVLFLPTRYTQGLLEFFSTLITIFFIVVFMFAQLLSFIITLPLTFLLQMFRLPPPPPLPLQVPKLPESLPPSQLPPTDVAWEALKSILFWIVLLGAVLYIVITYLRDRPELMAILKEVKVIRKWRGWWAKLIAWLRVLWGRVDTRWLETLRERLWGGAVEAMSVLNIFRSRPRTPREQILFFYLNILHRARQKGFARRETQTPYEYEPTLEANTLQAQSDAADLTQAFVQARYSQDDFSEDDVKHVKEEWERVKQALKKTETTR